MKRERIYVYVRPEQARLLDELAVLQGLSRSSIAAMALDAKLSPLAAEHRKVSVDQRLNRLTRHLQKLEHDQTIAMETLALFVRTFLAVTPPVPEAQHEKARASGRDRFDKFMQQLARQLEDGNSLLRDLHSAFYAGADDTDDADADGGIELGESQ